MNLTNRTFRIRTAEGSIRGDLGPSGSFEYRDGEIISISPGRVNGYGRIMNYHIEMPGQPSLSITESELGIWLIHHLEPVDLAA